MYKLDRKKHNIIYTTLVTLHCVSYSGSFIVNYQVFPLIRMLSHLLYNKSYALVNRHVEGFG